MKPHSIGIIKTVCILFALALLLILFQQSDITVQTILDYTPQNAFLAGMVLLGMYALKSLLVVFPLILLHIAGGLILPTVPALIVNTIGTFLDLSLPFFIGKHMGKSKADALLKNHPKIRSFFSHQKNSAAFISFFLRVISCLPGDLVSLYMGATGFSYWHNTFFGLFGILPGMILATILGANVENSHSPAFLISVTLTVLLSVGSLLIHRIYKKRHKEKEITSE